MDAPQFSNQADYYPENAYGTAYCANLAYKDSSEIFEELDNWSVSKKVFIDKSTTQGFIFKKDDVIIISFRGTEVTQKSDILADAAAIQTEAYEGRVHLGFNTAYNIVKDQVLKTVKEYQTNNEAIIITGHSLGGALATVCAAHLISENITPTSVYTYGQPRVGNSEFAEFYSEMSKHHYRFVNNNDVVTKVPPESVTIKGTKLSYTHVGQQVYIKTNGDLEADTSSFNKTVDGIFGRITSAVKGDFFDGLSDHSMVNYLDATEKNITVNPMITD